MMEKILEVVTGQPRDTWVITGEARLAAQGHLQVLEDAFTDTGPVADTDRHVRRPAAKSKRKQQRSARRRNR